MQHNFLTKLISCFALLALHASAQNLFLLSGSGSLNTDVQVYSSQLTSLGVFGAGSGAFIVVARPAGNEFYVISSGASQVTSVQSDFQTTRSIATLGAPATAAVESPTGNRLLVLAGTLHIFDTSTSTIFGTSSDTDLTGSAGLQAPSGTEVDFTTSLDGKNGFLLVQNASGSTLYEFDLTAAGPSLTGGRSLSISGPATNVAIAPNGLLYVSGPNVIDEINPTTMQLTAKGAISVTGTPGKPVFTPDGRYLIAQNKASTSPWIEVDLTTDAQVDTAHTGFTGVNPDTLLAVAAGTALGYSAQAQTLYTLTLAAPVSITTKAIPNVSQPGITAVAVSPEVAGGPVTGPHYLYFVAGSVLYRLDLTANQISQQVTLTEPADGITDTGAESTSAAATLLAFGGNQTLAANTLTLPLVVRVLDGNGLPLNAVAVAFKSTDSGVTIANSSVATANNGYASTTAVTAASTSGVNTITATVGSLAPVTFTLTVSGSGSTGTGTGTNGGLTIAAGQGIVAYQDLSVGNGYGPPLTVRLTDINGNPVPKATVMFTNTAPSVGSLSGGNANLNNGTVGATTDSSGMASVAYVTNAIQANLGHSQAAITASAAGTGTVTFYLTVISNNISNGGVARVDFSGAPASGAVIKGSAGGTLANALSVKIFDGEGVPIPNVSVRLVAPSSNSGGGVDATLDTDSPYATCATSTGQVLLTDKKGAATCNMKFLQQTVGGNQEIAVDVGYYLEHSFFVNVGPGLPATIKFAPASASGNPGQAVNTTVTVTDGSGNPVSGDPITFQVQTADTINLSSSGAVTNVEGQATLSGTLGSTSGTYQIAVTAGSITANFPYTVIIPVSSVAPLSGGNQTTLINTPFTAPLVVLVSTANGPAAGVPVTFAATNGAALSTTIVNTDATGKASTMVTAGSSAGPITVTATTPNGQSGSFSLTSILSLPPVISVSATSVTLSLTAGSTTQGLVAVGITNTGGGTLDWAATSDSAWLTVSPVAGTAPSTINISGSAANLAPGPYTGTVTISAPGATPVAITVSLTVAAGVTITSVVNGASFLAATASNGWITITGSELSQTKRTWQASDFVDGKLPTSLDGVSVTINGAAAYVYYISPTQINVLAPVISFQDGSNSAMVPIAVTAPDGNASSTVLIQTVAPAVFVLGDTKYAAAVHSDGALVAPAGTFSGANSRPAKAGETIAIFLSGLGTNTSPAIPAGLVPTEDSDLLDTVTVKIGGVSVPKVAFSGLVGAGLYQVNVVVPSVGKGNQTFVLTVDSVSTQAGVMVNVQ